MKWKIRVPKILANKYALTGLIFLTWVFFFDQNKVITQIQYNIELGKLEEEKEFYLDEIKQINKDLNDLQSNPASLEKFAREKYLMKKDQEELFVFVAEE